jgi:hypothetical protein
MDEVVCGMDATHGLVKRAYVEHIATDNLRGWLAV